VHLYYDFLVKEIGKRESEKITLQSKGNSEVALVVKGTRCRTNEIEYKKRPK